MRGLFYKDLKSTWQAIVISILIMMLEIVFFRDIGYDSKQIDYLIMVTSWIIVLIGAAIPSMLVSDDDRSGFFKYLKILPVNKYYVIGEKYIISLCLNVILTTIGVFNIYMADNESSEKLWWIICIAFPVALVVNSLIQFFIIKFGAEKAVGVSLIAFLLIIVFTIGITGYIGSYYNLENVIFKYKNHILIGGILISTVLYFTTVKIYIDKEY